MQKLSDNIKEELIDKYNVSGPYYSSYPVLSGWPENFGVDNYTAALNELTSKAQSIPAFLYIHFPFCAKQCYYCICNSIINHDRNIMRNYMDYIAREIELFHKFFKRCPSTPQFKMAHLGGGSPTLIGEEEFNIFIDKIRSLINIKELEDFAIEIDPRTTTKEKLKFYSEKGINRISFGIQDFDPSVQKAINRIQPPEMVHSLLTPEIKELFKSVNFDLLYGLPLQTRDSFRRTIETAMEFLPDRITLIKYAHVPEIRKHQRMINEDDLPCDVESTKIFIETTERFLEEGYEHIGIDHFAKPSDALAQSMREGKIWRNFLGVSPGGAHNIIGIGPTSTSSINGYYAQNLYLLEDYYKELDMGRFPILRGIKLNRDDLIRREVINAIICRSSLDFAYIEERHSICFGKYFSEELVFLKELADDGLLVLKGGSIKVTFLGRLFIRHICKVFDKYFKKDQKYRISGP
jgi:oxygen-independent coproporphyrinogen-3 oxidase